MHKKATYHKEVVAAERYSFKNHNEPAMKIVNRVKYSTASTGFRKSSTIDTYCGNSYIFRKAEYSSEATEMMAAY